MLSSRIFPLSTCFSISNSYIFLVIFVGALVPVPIGAIGYLLDRSTTSSFLLKGARSTVFCNFPSHTAIHTLFLAWDKGPIRYFVISMIGSLVQGHTF